MQNKILLQFLGFLNTQLIWKTSQLPYPLYHLKPIPISTLPETFELNPSMVLGKRMEVFFTYHITHYSNQEILAHNEQIIFNKKTIGELDFILKDSLTGKVSHIELVYKFYLYDPAIPEDHACWTGPNRKDSLDKKLQILENKQFPLLFKKETRPLLEKLKIQASEVHQELCFKAHLFVPKDLENISFDSINPKAISGFWIRSTSFTEAEYGDALFYSPKKADWPIEPKFNNNWKSFGDIYDEIISLLDQKQSPLLWMKSSDETYKRFFIVWW